MNHKIKVVLKTLRSIVYSIYFNFHYLPFKQAIRLPILLYKPCLMKNKGKIRIETSNIKIGLIRLGWDSVSLYYPNNRYGIVFENHGGVIVFKGGAIVGSGSAISVGPYGYLEFGDNFVITANAKIIAYRKVVFGDYFSGGWEVIVMDTDLHQTINVETGEKSEMSAEIKIGKYNWICSRAIIQKKTNTPDYCIVAASSIVNKTLSPSHCLFGSSKIDILKTGIYRDFNSQEKYD